VLHHLDVEFRMAEIGLPPRHRLTHFSTPASPGGPRLAGRKLPISLVRITTVCWLAGEDRGDAQGRRQRSADALHAASRR
jgi:hypothetical protein